MRSLAFRLPTGIEQDRRTSPFTWTEQAPHCAMPQPYLVPVSPTCSRITHRRGVSASTCTSRALPLILSLAIRCPPLQGGLTTVASQKYARRDPCRPPLPYALVNLRAAL